jgi:hypothetical protein
MRFDYQGWTKMRRNNVSSFNNGGIYNMFDTPCVMLPKIQNFGY